MLDQLTKLDILVQADTEKTVSRLTYRYTQKHIIWIPSLFLLLTVAANTNFIFFGLTRPWIKNHVLMHLRVAGLTITLIR